jgi:hypothetical protein
MNDKRSIDNISYVFEHYRAESHMTEQNMHCGHICWSRKKITWTLIMKNPIKI